jgi:hypothetical protein
MIVVTRIIRMIRIIRAKNLGGVKRSVRRDRSVKSVRR